MKKLCAVLIAALLCISAGLPLKAAYAADADAFIAARQSSDTIAITGHTSSADAGAVPLLITDALGQILYVQEVAGNGKAFALELVKPDWSAAGTAHATLFSATSATTDFVIAESKPPEKKKLEIVTSITGADKDVIVKQQTVHLKEGSSAFDLLKFICNENDIPYEVVDADGDGRDVYVKSINDLAEFDKGAGSGWIYLVNGEQPPMPIDRYKLDNKDTVSFVYTTDFGNSEGGSTSAGELTSLYRTSASAELEKAMSQIGFATKPEQLADCIDSLLIALAEYPVEKQKSYIPDVALVLQAAYEKAGMMKSEELATKPVGNTLAQELVNSTAKELLANQQDLLDRLTERLANWTLYKGLLTKLKPTLVIPMSEKATYETWQLTIAPDAWQTIGQKHARISMMKSGWRTDLVPSAAMKEDRPVVFSAKKYDDKAQSVQLGELSSETVPVTDLYRLSLSAQPQASIVCRWEKSSAIDSGSVPVLMARAKETEQWAISPTIVKNESQDVTASVKADGDVFFASVPQPAFADVQKLPDGYQWAKEAIGRLAAIEVVQGRSSSTFDWNAKLKRSEAIALVNRVNRASEPVALPDGSAAADQPINRAELAYLLAQTVAAAKESAGVPAAVSLFRDQAVIPSWAQAAVETAVAHEWLKGRTDGRFDPLAPLTRAEAAAALYRMLQE